MRITPRLSGLFIVSVSCHATHRGGASLLYDIGTMLKPKLNFCFLFHFLIPFMHLLFDLLDIDTLCCLISVFHYFKEL